MIWQTALFTLALFCPVLGNADRPVEKPYTLVMPAVLPLIGDGHRPAGACKLGATIAADMFNARPDFLTDFKVHLRFFDEGKPVSWRALTLLMSFYRLTQNNDTMIKSPIAVGPFTSPGCKPIASVAQHINIVQMAIGCGTPMLTAKRQFYPNFYRSRVGGGAALNAILQYVKNVGQWHQIAILTEAGNVFNYGVAKLMYLEAIRRGIQVPFFEIVAVIDEAAIQRLKNSKNRIIVFQVAGYPEAKAFLCLTHKLGLTGPRFVFFMFSYSFMRVQNLPDDISDVPGCTRDHIATQFKQVKFIGVQSSVDGNNVTSSLGYTYGSFLQNYFKRARGKIFADFVRKELCHDAMSKSLLALDEADKSLKQQNSSLREYATNPERVMKVVNQSMAAIDYISFQYGRSRFSKRLELDDHPHILFSRNEKTDGTHLEYSIHLPENGDPNNADDYVLNPVSPVKWKTTDGMPPSETYTEMQVTVDVPNQGYWAVLIVATILSVGQICLLVGANVKKRKCSGELEILLVGCLAFNAGAVIYSAKTSQNPSALCVARPIVATVAMALLETFFWMRLSTLSFRKITSVKQKTTSTTRTSSWKRRHDNAEINVPAIAEIKSPARVRTLAFCFLPPITLLVLWMLIHPVGFSVEHPVAPYYDDETDTMYYEEYYVCHSNAFVAWVMGIAAWNLVVITSAAFKMYKLKKARGINAITTYKGIQLGIINLEVMLIASMFVLATLQSPVDQQIALAGISLVFSALSGSVVFYFELGKPLESANRDLHTHVRSSHQAH